MPLEPATAAKAKQELNEPDEPEWSEAVAKLDRRFAEAVGAEEAQRFAWARLAALRQAKWDGDKALEKLKSLSAFARANEHLFENLTAEEFLEQAAIGVMSHLPARNKRGELVLLVHGAPMTQLAKKCTYQDMLRYSIFLMRELMHDEETQVNGVIIVENLQNYPMTALNKMQGAGLSNMRKSFDWLNVSSMRLRGIYACYQPWYVGFLMALVRPFMSKKLRGRVRLFGSDTAAMLEAAGLRLDQVPELYGGHLRDFEPDWFLKKVIAERSQPLAYTDASAEGGPVWRSPTPPRKGDQ